MTKRKINKMTAAMTPKEIVLALDKYVIGQTASKTCCAIACRNRWRRMQLNEPLRSEVIPKNILMIGPTGVGKTEIARRLAHLTGAPFIKVEATRYTEIGYVGREVESMVKELLDMAIQSQKEIIRKNVYDKAVKHAEKIILDKLVPLTEKMFDKNNGDGIQAREKEIEKVRVKLIAGELDEDIIEVEVSTPKASVEIMTPPGMEDMVGQLSGLLGNLGRNRKKKRNLKIKYAMKYLVEDEIENHIDNDEIKMQAIYQVEQNGIIFIDEIDKICKRSENVSGSDVSREGVQRDLLPLVEGCSVSTKYGIIKTDHILFIASGAFQTTSPSDLIPELQGRFPIRVELKALTINDLQRILTEPTASLTEQYIALFATEDITISFRKEGIARLADIAWQINERHENIGARRLHTVLEKLLEKASFEASDMKNKKIIINKKYVDKYLQELLEDEDLSRWIL